MQIKFFLDPTSEYYNENVCGAKTGSQSDASRYDDVNFMKAGIFCRFLQLLSPVLCLYV